MLVLNVVIYLRLALSLTTHKLNIMRTFDIEASSKETILAKICINTTVYNAIDDETLENCLNDFLYNIGTTIRVTVCNKDITLYNNVSHNAFLRTSVNHQNIWFLYGFKETTYYVKERVDSK